MAQGRQAVAFLCCSDDESKLARLEGSIHALEPHPGTDVGLFAVHERESIGRAYNRLLDQAAGWRYKVYVHQDVVLLNRGLVADLLRLFRHRALALVGVAGVRFLPPSYVWWNGSGLYGRVLEDHGRGPELRDFGDPDGDYARVECVDGLFLATQYDLPWDERIPGFHFYDVAQSTRFLLRGYDVGVARQHDAWVRHDIGERDDRPSPAYESSRLAFAQIYGSRRDRFVRSRVRRRARRLSTRARLALTR
jgi:Glycosyltransferase like family